MSSILKGLTKENLLKTYGDQLGIDEETPPKAGFNPKPMKKGEGSSKDDYEYTAFQPKGKEAKEKWAIKQAVQKANDKLKKPKAKSMDTGFYKNYLGNRPFREGHETIDEWDAMFIYDPVGKKMYTKHVRYVDQDKAHNMGYRDTPEQALRYYGIIKSKFNPGKYVKKQDGRWVTVDPFKQDSTESSIMKGIQTEADKDKTAASVFNKETEELIKKIWNTEMPGMLQDGGRYLLYSANTGLEMDTDSLEDAVHSAQLIAKRNLDSPVLVYDKKTKFPVVQYRGSEDLWFQKNRLHETEPAIQNIIRQNPKGSASEKMLLKRYIMTPMVQDMKLDGRQWINQATKWLAGNKEKLAQQYPDLDLTDIEGLAEKMYEDFLAMQGQLEETHSTGTTIGSAGIGGGSGIGIEASPTTKILQAQVDEGEVVSLQAKKIAKIVNQYPIIFATSSRGSGINDVDLIFKDLRTNKIVAHVVGNNYRPSVINGKKRGGPQYEIRINRQGLKSEGGPPSYVAYGNPQVDDDDHFIFTLTPSKKKIEKTPGPGGTTKLRPDQADVVNYMLSSGTYYGYDFIPESNEDWHTFLQKQLGGKFMDEDLAVELGYVYRKYDGDLVFLQQPQTISGEKITIPQDDWESQGIESPYEPRTPNLKYFNLDDIKETIQSSQGGMGQAYRKVNTKAPLNEYSVVDNVIQVLPAGLDVSQFYAKAYPEYLYNLYYRAEKQNFLSVAKGWYDEYKKKHNMKEYNEKRAPMLIKDIDRIEDLLYTLPKGLDFHKFVDVALKQYINHKYSTKHWDEWKNKLRYQYWAAYQKAGKDKPQGMMAKVKGWFKEEQAPMFTPEEEQIDELKCWTGYKRVPGKSAGEKGSCTKAESAVMKGLKEFSPERISPDERPEEFFRNLASHWKFGDEAARQSVEKTLAQMDYTIGDDPRYNPEGVYITRRKDYKGKSYKSWSYEELKDVKQ